MRYHFGKTIVIALGGSVVHPDTIDVAFLKKFRALTLRFTKKGTKFVFVVGGGRLARVFQVAASAVRPLSDTDKDWIGIHATRLNGHLVRTVFSDMADTIMIEERGQVKKLTRPVTVGAGWHPGWSTDYVSVQLAADFKAHAVIVAGKPSHVYSKDPVKYKNAKKFSEMTWREYRSIIPKKWKPGLHTPVDPVAARLAEKEKIDAIIVYGKDLKNFGNLLNGKEFTGTIIR